MTSVARRSIGCGDDALTLPDRDGLWLGGRDNAGRLVEWRRATSSDDQGMDIYVIHALRLVGVPDEGPYATMDWSMRVAPAVRACIRPCLGGSRTCTSATATSAVPTFCDGQLR